MNFFVITQARHLHIQMHFNFYLEKKNINRKLNQKSNHFFKFIKNPDSL